MLVISSPSNEITSAIELNTISDLFDTDNFSRSDNSTFVEIERSLFFHNIISIKLSGFYLKIVGLNWVC